MKLNKIYLLAALALGLASCNDEDSLGIVQTNPQEPVMPADAVSASAASATATAVSLAQYESTGLVPVLDVTKLENFPEYYQLKGVMEYATDASFSNAKEINLTVDGMTLYAPAAKWETAHLELYSKNPRETQSYVRFALYGVNGTTEVRLGDGNNIYFASHEIKVTPFPAAVVVEENYYLIGDATAQMNPSNPADVYDPPTFSAQVSVEAGQPVSVQIKSESGLIYGQDPEKADGLKLNAEPIVLTQAGPYLITVNMEELTYEVTSAIEAIYAYGASAKNGYELATSNFVNYRGYAGLNLGYFKLADAKSNYTMRWGQAQDADGNDIPGSIHLCTGEENPVAIQVPSKGCYWLDVNLAALTYSAYYVEYFGLIGGWDGWAGDVVMTPTDKYFTVWTAELTITDGTEFKIRTNGDWDGPDLGNSGEQTDLSDLVDHGGNLVWSEGDGTFTVTLDVSTIPYKLTAVKQ